MSERKLTRFGIAIKKRLVEKQITQVELAKRVGTSKKYISSVMYRQYPFTKSKIMRRILDELDLDKDLLL